MKKKKINMTKPSMLDGVLMDGWGSNPPPTNNEEDEED